MDEKSKINFENLLRGARSGLETLKEFQGVLLGRVEKERGQPEIKQWITDVFADKVYATNAELHQALVQIPSCNVNTIESASDALAISLTDLAHSNWELGKIRTFHIPRINGYIIQLIKETEKQFVFARKHMYLQGWTGLSEIKSVEPLDTQRKKYVSARECLAKARECLNGKVEDVTLHLRTTIDLSLRERFHFSKIHPMKTFLKDANKNDFPLPSYNLIYGLFDEGSSRIHEGTGNTAFEAKQMIRMVSDFIDSLETITISNEEIDKFKSKSHAVE